jgi:hypothetical protein
VNIDVTDTLKRKMLMKVILKVKIPKNIPHVDIIKEHHTNLQDIATIPTSLQTM